MSMFTKEINLEIIKALKLFGPISNHDKTNWKKLHAYLAQEIREVKRTKVQYLKKHVMKLMFDIKENKFNLPKQVVQILCYPYLVMLLKIKLTVSNSYVENCGKLTCEKLNRQIIIIKYLLSNSFDQELWDKLHKLSAEYPEEYHVIYLRNPLYRLTEKEKMLLKRFSFVDKSKTIKQIPFNLNQKKWLGKKVSLTDASIDWIQANPDNLRQNNIDNVAMHEEHTNSVSAFNQGHENRSSDELHRNAQSEEFSGSKTLSNKKTEFSGQTEISNSLSKIKDIDTQKGREIAVLIHSSFTKVSTQNTTFKNGKDMLLKPTYIEISSDSEEEFSIPFSFYDDISSDSEIELNEIENPSANRSAAGKGIII